MSNQKRSDEKQRSLLDSSSTTQSYMPAANGIASNKIQTNTGDFTVCKTQNSFQEYTSLKQQHEEVNKQKQAIEVRSTTVLDETRRIIENHDSELGHSREAVNIPFSTNTLASVTFAAHQLNVNQLLEENTHLKTQLQLKEKIEQENQALIQRLQLRITALEDWNDDEDNQNDNARQTTATNHTNHSELQSTIDSLVSRNRQLENELQRLQFQQKNNQLALERLDEYEETIVQLQEELNQLRSNKKKQQSDGNEDASQLLIEERKRHNATSSLLDETRQILNIEKEQSKERLVQRETQLMQQFQEEKLQLDNLLASKDKQIEIEKKEHEDLQRQINDLQQFKNDQEESRSREIYVREMLERQIIELNEQVQAVESDKNDLVCQIHELQQQLQSKDRLIQTIQASSVTPGAPPTTNPSMDIENLASSVRSSELESQMTSIHSQFLSLLPGEYQSANDSHSCLTNQFMNLFEQFSSYIGSFSIMQEEFESLKQILVERQDELEKLRTHLAITTDKLTRYEEEQSLSSKDKSVDSDEDELEEILGYQQRAPSRQSLLSITPGEKQQLVAQNELLSSLLTEKEQELISLQQAEKSHDDLLNSLESFQLNLQLIEHEKDMKQKELNDIKNVLDEKLRETSSLKKEKMYFIEKLAELERERQEQQYMIQMLTKQSSSSSSTKEKSPIKLFEQNASTYPNDNVSSTNINRLTANQQDESLSYYDEYKNTLTLYNDLKSKHNQLEIDYNSIQSLIQQKNEAYLQCQNELNVYQNLLYQQKKKSDDIDLLREILNEREAKLQELTDSENQQRTRLSALELHVKTLEESNSKLKSNQVLFDQIQIDLKRVTHERDFAVVEKKQIEHELDLIKDKLCKLEEHEQKLMNEVERLLPIEKSLKTQLDQFDHINREQKEFIHQISVNSERSQQDLSIKYETLKVDYIKIKETNEQLSDQLQEEIKQSRSLLLDYNQFQQEHEKSINEHLSEYQETLRQQISISARLTNENNELHQRLLEFDALRSTVHGLIDEIKTKDVLIIQLQTDIDIKKKQITDYEEVLRSTNGARVDKQLVKNMLLSYFNTPIDKQQEAIPILGALVGFTQDEYQKVSQAISNNSNHMASSSWLTGWLSTNSSKPKAQSNSPFDQMNKSFAELLIQYVDQESVSNLNTDAFSDHQNPTNSTASSHDHPVHLSLSNSTNAHGNQRLRQQSSLPASTSKSVDDILTI